MKQLSRPNYNALQIYLRCVGEVNDEVLRTKYLDNQGEIDQSVLDFDAASATRSWYALPRAGRGDPQVVIRGTLTKGELVALYGDYLVGGEHVREVYDELLVSSDGKCPFCGGIGQVRTVDHFLPKSNFPIYSVLPDNLVPCCRDCNTGKMASFASTQHEQSLHPYLDSPSFFTERWVIATVTRTDPISIGFSCSPPAGWGDTDRRRAEAHFNQYDLARRYRIQAGAELARVIDLRKKSLRVLSAGEFGEYLRENADTDAYDLNGWNRTMYWALAGTEWFQSANFSEPASYLQAAMVA
ncbi:HNH endonuclease [Rhizobium sp. NLR10a]|uniref:HNH endonuclease n=1 Tax=unclassified Rhizobium TaxID=2613769 RepID=UPI001C830BEF|nr:MULTISPECIES: HNH endonuclease [unclassified Rhizobium]MBX5213960.1 HNH endonuclease [Rhizobium sp. NLR9a]MBX5218891.1 HNH endonuclease [Rhizobium sp. NLR8a]MBX5275349.1 HNH endonuclease [Rhizobium sp. NLR13a]MBX5281136.1 HNH endonuclease [Rhizobium sp. NLR10a]MBX5295447.1 HNH endonuclease [Rhizobium sp. NLR15a]